MTDALSLTCATWNIHRARGADGRVDPDRIARVLLSDVWTPATRILALQEADAETPPHHGLLDLTGIETATGLRSVHAEGLRWGPQSHGFLGSVLLLHPATEVTAAALLDLPGLAHRGAVVVETRETAGPLRIVTAHLSLSQPLRIAQMRTIGQHIRRRPAMPTLLLGDLNEWRPWGGLALSPRVTGLRLQGPGRATFPAQRPLLPLDRVLIDPPGRVLSLQALDTPGIRAASDHRPLRARVAPG